MEKDIKNLCKAIETIRNHCRNKSDCNDCELFGSVGENDDSSICLVAGENAIQPCEWEEPHIKIVF